MSSTKRKPPHLCEGDADRSTPYNTDIRPTKKGKRKHAPCGGGRRDPPATTRKPNYLTNIPTSEPHDRVPSPRNWRFALAWTGGPGKRSHFVRPSVCHVPFLGVTQNDRLLAEAHLASRTRRVASGVIRGRVWCYHFRTPVALNDGMSDRSRSGETVESADARSQLCIPWGYSRGRSVESVLPLQGELSRSGP